MRNPFWDYWKLHTDHGRQVWEFKPPQNFNNAEDEERFMQEMFDAFNYDKKTQPNSGDRVYRASMLQNVALPEIDLKKDGSLTERAFDSALNGLSFYKHLQQEDGHWPGDYGGPMFLLPGLIIASHITNTPFPKAYRTLMRRYLFNHQNDDGGWGLHIEGESTMFGTVMQYVALRILGESAEDAKMARAQEWIKKHGGATGIPSWGKFYLSVLNVYEWEGCNSLFPEMWLLPYSLPVHPGRYWCHCRMVYLPMAYCYGHRVKAKEDELIRSLRKEIYIEDYEQIDWKQMRDKCTVPDHYWKQSGWLKFLNRIINWYEKRPLKRYRNKALDFVLEYIDAEDMQTKYVDIGPVNQVINSIAVWHAYGPESAQFKGHVDRWKDYLWVAEDGMKMNGYNGSQLWDTAFAAQAIIDSGLHEYIPEPLQKAYDYFEMTQVLEDTPELDKFYRHISDGAWPFSTLDHGWPISDCTAEGLKASLMCHGTGVIAEQKVTPERMEKAVNVILSFQNEDGGWATYENTRGPSWLEKLNPSEVFGNIMVDYSWVECTSACMQALAKFKSVYPGHRSSEIEKAFQYGVDFLTTNQRDDGSWIGSWAVCFTYGTWFGVQGLLAAGIPATDPRIQNACSFLISKQKDDGGWGESFESCVHKRYVQHEESQVVNTSWALLTLMSAEFEDRAVIDRGVKLLMERQQSSGDWEQEGISGVFNLNCMITYTAYRNVFPIWALGTYARKYGDTSVSKQKEVSELQGAE